MEKNKFAKKTAKKIATVLDAALHVEANSTSCLLIYQPKAPDKLSHFRNSK